MLKFKPIELKDAANYTASYNKCEEKAGDYTFTNLWCWQDKYKFELAYADNLYWLRHHDGDKIVYNPPIGKWDRDDWESLIHKYFPDGFGFTRVPDYLTEKLQSVFGDNLEVADQREHWEYVYSIQELISLHSYRYRNKRKLSNQFKRTYNYIYKKVSPELLPDIEAFQKQWLAQPEVANNKDMDSLKAENTAILKMLHNWDKLPNNIFGGVLIVDNRIIAYTLGEVMDDNMVVIHFEKALYSIKGAYQAINRICLENLGSYYRFVNREQDLGLKDLRRAKLDYNPVKYIKKSRLSYQK